MHRFQICKFAYALTFTYNPQIITHATFTVLVATHVGRAAKDSTHLMCAFLAEVDQGDTAPSRFGSHTTCPVHSLFSALFFCFL